MYAALHVGCASLLVFCWYDAMRIATASWSSSVVSRSLAMASTLASSGISTCTVNIPISVGMMASVSYVRVNGDTPSRLPAYCSVSP